MRFYFHNTILLLKKLGIALFIFSLSRIIFLLFNTAHFSDISISLFFYGLRFDLVAISYFFAPLILLQLIPFSFRNYKWYQQLLAFVFYLGNTIAISLNLIDVAYFDFTLKRMLIIHYRAFIHPLHSGIYYMYRHLEKVV